VLADHFDEVVAIDISKPLIEIARARRSHPRIIYVEADLAEFEDPDGFDLVFSSSAIHHLPDLRSALVQLRGLVAPGGVAVLIDQVSLWPTPPRWVYYVGSLRTLPGHVWRVGWRAAWWMFRFQTSRPWLEHVTNERYLGRPEFRREYGSVFLGAQFEPLGFAEAITWHNG
jgi:SAM-dependent methyltransferase